MVEVFGDHATYQHPLLDGILVQFTNLLDKDQMLCTAFKALAMMVLQVNNAPELSRSPVDSHWARSKPTASMVLSLFALLLWPRISAAQVGQIATVYGNSQLRRGAQVESVSPAMPLFLNDQVTTEPASSLAINLNGGAELELGESSTIVLDEHVLPPNQSAFRTRIGLLRGKVHSIVPHVAVAADFEVHTPNAVTSVRGTDFGVAFSDGTLRFGYPGCTTFTDVTVYSGTVSVASIANPTATVDIPEGFSTTVACDQAPLPPGPSGLEGMNSGSVRGPGAATAPPPPAAAPAPPPAPPPPVSF
jgi:hypothetical protein